MTPLLFNLNNKKALVVGGGKVAARRIVTLLENGMQVIAVSLDFSEAIERTENNQLTLISAGYHKEQLVDIDLAVAATDNRALNRQIKRDCQSQKIWCNRVDDPEDSDFIFPSVIRRGDLTLSVCTEGASPFLTKHIVDELADRYDDSYTEKTALLRLLRQAILAGAGSPQEKTAKLKELSRCSNAELRSKLGNN
ncbi:MAG: bifunctional precorrin-2 dehydrogenase/sirohydrochlorin ferrochelatase [Acetobacterium sp.]|uniref:precorrin-2 dehydrogenase/sirohydrochlorin ferrochelatase family protein n=1 Tax=Acetobacterium sp. TaxID=1872094 RepID=UPI003242219D